MKKHFYVLLLLLIPAGIFGQSVFQKTYSHLGYESGSTVIRTLDGGYLIGGSTGSSQFGTDKIFLVKTDSDGAIQWTKNYGGAISDYVASMIQNADGSYMLVGTTYSFNAQPYGNIYVLKLDVNGNHVWSKHYGGSGYDFGYSIQATSDGGYIVGGLTSSFGAGYYDYFIMKIDGLGIPAWGTSIGGGANDEGFSIAIMDDGTYLIAGQSNSFAPVQMVIPYQMLLCKLSATGSLIWAKTYSSGTSNCICQQMIKTSDGGCIMAGWTDGFGQGMDEAYIVKTDSAGNEQWSSAFGGPGMEVIFSVCERVGGGYGIAGYTESYGAGGQDMYLTTLDSAGNFIWSTCYGDTADDRCNGLIATTDGGFLLSGITSSFSPGGSDLYLVKTDASGYSGCYENDAFSVPLTPVTIVDTITPVIGSGATWLFTTTQTGTGGAMSPLCGNLGITVADVPGIQLQLLPNPASATVLIATGNADLEQIEVMDALGRIVYQKEKIKATTFSLDISNWNSGVYFVRTHAKGAVQTERLLVL